MNTKNFMMLWLKDLFPICRSLTGRGTYETIRYLQRINSNLKIISFNSGKKVFDWVIPKEWNIKDAYIEHESGKKYAKFSENNLHVLGYSEAINTWLSKQELLKNIHTEPNQQDWIPYVTSYYKKRWGFCMSENEKNVLPEGKYKAYIDSSFKNGKLNIVEANIKGHSKKEIFFSTYFCHPSMANDNLSGPVVMSALLKYLNKNFNKRKFSYRFVFLPETIGSIAYLSKNVNKLKKNVIAGFNLSCVGDEKAYSHISSRQGNCLADLALSSALIGLKNVKNYSFLHRGSDERQYCSPGVDLPLCGFSRSKFGQYPEYHTSADNLSLVSNKGLNESLGVLKNIVDAFELGLFPKTKFLGEPQLGKRNLYPTLSQKGYYDKQKAFSKKVFNTRMNVITYSDGKTNIFEIAKILNMPLKIIIEEIKILKKNQIIF